MPAEPNAADSTEHNIRLRVYKSCLIAEDMGDTVFDDVCASLWSNGKMYIKPFGSHVLTPSDVRKIDPTAVVHNPRLSAEPHLSLSMNKPTRAGIVSLRLNTAGLTVNAPEVTYELNLVTRGSIPFDLRYTAPFVIITSWSDNLLRAVEQCCEAAEILRRILEMKQR